MFRHDQASVRVPTIRLQPRSKILKYLRLSRGTGLDKAGRSKVATLRFPACVPPWQQLFE